MKVVVINGFGKREEYNTADDAIMSLSKKLLAVEKEINHSISAGCLIVPEDLKQIIEDIK